LTARANELRVDCELLEQANVKTADRADIAELVRLGTALAAVQAGMEQRREDAHQRWREDEGAIEKGAGLAEIGFPPGIFDCVNLGYGIGEKSVWRDHVLGAIALAYPDLLPGTDAADILAMANPAPRWYAQFVAWDAHPLHDLG
jgi:hypothetical protein